MIKLENISKTYNLGTDHETKVFKDFNLQFKKNEFVSLSVLMVVGNLHYLILYLGILMLMRGI